MGKLKVLSGREVRAILEANGYVYARQKGSHMMMVLRLDDTTITVPVPDHKELRIGTLSDIVRQSGVPREQFEV